MSFSEAYGKIYEMREGVNDLALQGDERRVCDKPLLQGAFLTKSV